MPAGSFFTPVRNWVFCCGIWFAKLYFNILRSFNNDLLINLYWQWLRRGALSRGQLAVLSAQNGGTVQHILKHNTPYTGRATFPGCDYALHENLDKYLPDFAIPRLNCMPHNSLVFRQENGWYNQVVVKKRKGENEKCRMNLWINRTMPRQDAAAGWSGESMRGWRY